MWSEARADRAAANRRPLPPAFPRRDWAAIAEARCASRPTLPDMLAQTYASRIPARGHVGSCDGPFAFWAFGPMARTIRDVTLSHHSLRQVLLDPVSPPIGLRNESLEDLRRAPIAFFEDDGLIPVTPETRQAVRDAARTLETGLQRAPVSPQGAGGGAAIVVEVFCRRRRLPSIHWYSGGMRS